MRMSTPSIPCSLGRMAPQSPANAEELRATGAEFLVQSPQELIRFLAESAAAEQGA